MSEDILTQIMIANQSRSIREFDHQKLKSLVNRRDSYKGEIKNFL
jgi:hypothetical protein